MFNRVLVANRGEIAVRVIRALHELGVEAVAVYSTADEDALHVRLADRAVRIGPPAAAESYLSIPALIAAAETTGCEAVHPGYGFLSENADFVRACEDNDLVFIGPPARGDGADGRQGAREGRDARGGRPARSGHRRRRGAGRRARGSRGARVPGAAEGRSGRWGEGHADGRRSRATSTTPTTAPSAEAQAAFGDGSLYVEKVITPARHVEIQVLCDNHGHVLTCGERECSVQRRHQKLIEESPSPALDDERREAMEAAAERACRHIGYRNAGTFEFLVGPDGSFSFIELNTRLQVEHPVTESIIGIDLVREQVRIAAGDALAHGGRAGPRSGHAIELRINAEDPARGFAPAPGRIERFRPPLGPGVRVDTFVEDGTVDLAALRLADREGDRPGQQSPPRDRAGAARAGRARDRGRPHDAGRAAGHPRQRRVPQRRVLDVLPRGGRSAAAGAGAAQS